jgi:hypothetical protein
MNDWVGGEWFPTSPGMERPEIWGTHDFWGGRVAVWKFFDDL